ncbi:MAG: glycoside hydrolase family 2 protein [Solirubrobacteraceae bacterium]
MVAAVLATLMFTLAASGTAPAQTPPYPVAPPYPVTQPYPVTPPYTVAPPYPITPPYTAQPPTRGALYRDGQTDRYLLGGTWLYRPDLGNVGLTQKWWQGTAGTGGWSEVTVPNSYNAGDYATTSWQGWVGWYRRDFTAPAGAFESYVPSRDRRWIIRFESVDYQAMVWLNGHFVGSHIGENLPFELDLTGVRPGVNRLIVRVDNRRMPGQPPPGPGGGWWNFGGIQREVYLRAVQRADIAAVQVRTPISCPTGEPIGSPGCVARIEEQALVRNVTGAAQTVALRGAFGSAKLNFGVARIAPHAIWTADASVPITDPDLWSIDHPALYRASLRLTDSKGRLLGGYVTYSGIRTITLTPDGRLELNGRLLNLRGVEIREQDLQTGAALDPGQLSQLVEWAKELGATLIRADPLNPQIEELADRDGILIWSDIPVDQQVSSQDLAEPAFLTYAHAMLQDNILTNQNHPSILLWSIANELPTPATAAEASYISGAVALARRLDPTRPVGMAISDWPGVACQQAYAPLQVIGFNDYFGWFDAGGGATDDRDALSPFLDTLRSCYPSKALFVSEFGFDSNFDGPVEERGTYEFQSNSAAFHLGVFASKPWLSGAIYFLLQDAATYPSYSGGDPFPDPPFDQKGLINPQGVLKPAFAVVASIYKATQQLAPAPPHVIWAAPVPRRGDPSAGCRASRCRRRLVRSGA